MAVSYTHLAYKEKTYCAHYGIHQQWFRLYQNHSTVCLLPDVYKRQGKLWFLQTRNGQRTGAALVKIDMDLLRQGMIDEKTALERCEPNKLDELLHPVFDKKALKEAKVLRCV